ncbi:DUF1190 domain-containing protein [Vreelandella rituensis]|uniref:DUF1190 domain-containing protein n=1 Tax=Vreelandella rituensis TaxID=2282306 RepID=A0A368UD24_9GAMM|nr:DUF1190 domain-containing protein [Halomonas rituensis]RCV93583.1 DUF1190 domain-containing protein [Halomonas rituensis]
MSKKHSPNLSRRKRSVRLTLALMGAGAAVTLAGCADDNSYESYEAPHVTGVAFSDPNPYRDVEECVEAKVYTRQTCETSYADSLKAAPRFDSLEACEQAHGEGACAPPTQEHLQASGGSQNSGGGWFAPALMGYMVGNMMSASSNGSKLHSAYHEPVYRNRENRGNWNAATAATTTRLAQRHNEVSKSVAATGRSITKQRAATAKSMGTQRSGFGSRSSARGGFGS